jgi:hypothetical protein
MAEYFPFLNYAILRKKVLRKECSLDFHFAQGTCCIHLLLEQSIFFKEKIACFSLKREYPENDFFLRRKWETHPAGLRRSIVRERRKACGIPGYPTERRKVRSLQVMGGDGAEEFFLAWLEIKVIAREHVQRVWAGGLLLPGFKFLLRYLLIFKTTEDGYGHAEWWFAVIFVSFDDLEVCA